MRRLSATNLILFFIISNLLAQTKETVILETAIGKLEGTLLIPGGKKKFPLVLTIKGMNHVLKESVIDKPQNLATYSDPELPLISGLIEK